MVIDTMVQVVKVEVVMVTLKMVILITIVVQVMWVTNGGNNGVGGAPNGGVCGTRSTPDAGRGVDRPVNKQTEVKKEKDRQASEQTCVKPGLLRTPAVEEALAAAHGRR
jgi:hypothetical protein